MMSNSSQIAGNCVPTMSLSETIISKCRRTWNKERRMCVLLRTIKRPLSVFDYIPEQILDAHLKDAFEYLPKQREYILYNAILGSAVVRSIRRLDCYRATPLALKSLPFPEEESYYAYEFRIDFPTSPILSGVDAVVDEVRIPRKRAPLRQSEDSEIHAQIHDDASKLEDAAYIFGERYTSTPDSSEFYAEDRVSSREWTPLPESDDIENLTPIHDDASMLKDAAYEIGQQFTSTPDSSEFYADEDRAISREWTTPVPESENSEIQTPIRNDASMLGDANESGQKLSSTADASEFYREWTSVPEFEGHSEIQPLIHNDASMVEDADEFGSEFTSTPDSSEFYAVEDGVISREWTPSPEFEKSEIQTPVHDAASILEADLPCGKPQQGIEYTESAGDIENCAPAEQSASEEDDKSLQGDSEEDNRSLEGDSEEDNKSLEEDSEEDHKRLEGDSEEDDKSVEEEDSEGDDKSIEEDSEEDDKSVEEGSEEDDKSVGEDSEEDDKSVEEDSEEDDQSVEEDNEEDDQSLEGDSPEPRKLFPIKQPASPKPPQADLDLRMTTWCPAPLRRFLTPKGIKQFNAFEDWFVRPNGGIHPDADNQKYISKASSPAGPGNEIFFFTEECPEADSPGPRQLFPAHQSHPAEFDPPQLAPQMGIHCPRPVRKHATHEVILRPELFDDWFVDMRELVFVDEAFSRFFS